MRTLFLTGLLALASIAATAQTTNALPYVQVGWTPPALPAGSLLGYKVWYGPASGVYPSYQSVPGQNTTNATISFPRTTTTTTWYLACVSVSTNMLESVYSNEITWVVDGQPSAPLNMQIIKGQH